MLNYQIRLEFFNSYLCPEEPFYYTIFHSNAAIKNIKVRKTTPNFLMDQILKSLEIILCLFNEYKVNKKWNKECCYLC